MSYKTKGRLQREHNLNCCLELAKQTHYKEITRDSAALCSGITSGLISHYFGSMEQLRQEIISLAVTRDEHAVIAQSLVSREPQTESLSTEVKKSALLHCL